jgi:hypothetical protein
MTMNPRIVAAFAAGLAAVGVIACGGGAPPPKVEPPKEEARPTRSGPLPMVSQELGSIDPRAVEKTFASLEGKLEACHRQGRDRIEYLTGDVKVFMRIDGSGRVRYAYFEESTLGDRDTEKCILDVFSRASWPRPEGGEAEVRNGFGWTSGGEREPATWSADKVTSALSDHKDTKKDVEKCKAGTKGGFVLTAYVVQDDGAEPEPAGHKPASKPKPSPKNGHKGDKDKGGKFQAIGVAVSNKEAAEKIDCVVDALKSMRLPSPGSYAAKVTFLL